jgi:hypothetical protein
MATRESRCSAASEVVVTLRCHSNRATVTLALARAGVAAHSPVKQRIKSAHESIATHTLDSDSDAHTLNFARIVSMACD